MPGFALVLESFKVLNPEIVPIFSDNDFVRLFKMKPQRGLAVVVERERSHCIETCGFVAEQVLDVIIQVEKVQAHGVLRSRSCLTSRANCQLIYGPPS